MQFLRSVPLLSRLILAWFVMTMGIAIASPIVHPEAMELVCSASGTMKLIAIGDDGIEQSHHTLDCPMCMGIALPAGIVSVRFEQPQPLAHALHKFNVAHIASVAGAPLPPRGPPAAI
jgi:hypothetical protein